MTTPLQRIRVTAHLLRPLVTCCSRAERLRMFFATGSIGDHGRARANVVSMETAVSALRSVIMLASALDTLAEDQCWYQAELVPPVGREPIEIRIRERKEDLPIAYSLPVFQSEISEVIRRAGHGSLLLQM